VGLAVCAGDGALVNVIIIVIIVCGGFVALVAAVVGGVDDFQAVTAHENKKHINIIIHHKK
jgi:hypothetical protein